MKGSCSLCGNTIKNTFFKGGYVCEDCLHYIKLAHFDVAADPTDKKID